MRISLLYNMNAGDTVQIDEIREAVARHGHEIVAVSYKSVGLDELVKGQPELIAVAGGDGTIAAAARRFAGCGLPLAVLPLGAADNIAEASASEDLGRGIVPNSIAT
jgi:diacylglycerol kinase family enzyme